uniref:Uncharacterized protein n=1 Tax=viral metagenome TaxID=1070528 RepID=A0A6C0I4V1_9ZZZZ
MVEHRSDPVMYEVKTAIVDIVTIITIFNDTRKTGNVTPFLYSLNIATQTSFNPQGHDEDVQYLLDRAARYDEDGEPDYMYFNSENLHHLFSMIKSYIIDNGYYCALLIRAKDSSLAHYFTLEDIRHGSILLKDSYGEYDPHLYSVLGTGRSRGVVTIPISRLLKRMEYIETFEINILSSDKHLNEIFNLNGHFLDKIKLSQFHINKLNIGNEEEIGRTILGDALAAKYYNLCNMLLDLGASPDTQNGFGLTPFILSTRDPGANSITKRMIEMGADIINSPMNETAIANIASHGKNADGTFENVELFRLLLEHLTPGYANLLAGKINLTIRTQILLSDEDLSDRMKEQIRVYSVNTALKFAIFRNNVELCRLLIENGAIVHESNVYYNSQVIVLALSIYQTDPKIIEMILKKNPLTREVLKSEERRILDNLAKVNPELIHHRIGGGTKRKICAKPKKSVKKRVFS